MNYKSGINRAKQLRSEGTCAERVLWLKLRAKQLGGIKFRRQEAIGKYIVDFVSFDRKIIIEIDGGQHNAGKIAATDKARTTWLESQGFRVIRFWNNEVIGNLEGVVHKIQEAIEN